MDNFRVHFEKPNLKELSARYTVVDMHFHTNHSDGINTPQNIIKRAKKLGIGIAITDHNEIKGAVEVAKAKGLLVIPGIEVTSKEGTHILFYFYEVEGKTGLKQFFADEVKPYLGVDVMSSTSRKMFDLLKASKKYQCISVFPHPYSVSYTGICNHHFSQYDHDQLFDMVDGVEAINSENLKNWNLLCTILALNLNKVVVGGSDGHTLYHMGKVVTYALVAKNRTAFLDALYNKRNHVIGKEIDMLRKITSNGFKLKRNLKNYPDLVEKSIAYSYKSLGKKLNILKEKVKSIKKKGNLFFR